MTSGLLPNHRDEAVRPQDDLFEHTNGVWLRETPMPADRARYGTFDLLREESERRVRELITEAAADETATPGSPARKVGDLYASFMDEEAVEAAGLTPIEGELEAARSVQDVPGLLSTLGRFQREGLGGLFSIYVDNDAKNPEEYVVLLEQAGIGLPDEAYYREEEHAEVLAAYREHVARMMGLAGLAEGDEATAMADRVVDLEQRIAAAHWDRVARRDAVKTYNRMAWSDLVDATGVDAAAWDGWLQGLGAPEGAFDEVVVRQPSFASGLGELLRDVPVETWREWLLWRVVTGRAPYLTTALVDESFDFHGRTLSGLEEQRERWKRGVEVVEHALGEEVGKLYVARWFPPEAKERMVELVDNVIEAFRRSFATVPWMGDATREKALEKLGTFNPKVGYPDEWKDYSALDIAADDLLGNVRRASAWETDRELGKIGQPLDRGEWFMAPQTVNAYYNPGMNEIVFPAGILQPPFFDPQADDAVNYGGIGAVIGHEIGHGFDDQGSRYDASGALENWWTDEDRARFEERSNALIAQFDELEPRNAPGHKVKGALTVGENIGDLGGLAIGLAAYRIAVEKSGEPAPELDGYTGDQRFFLGWAQVWKGIARTEEAKRLLSIDPHSPADVRANAARNVDAFHEAFSTEPGDGMWLDPEQRVTIF